MNDRLAELGSQVGTFQTNKSMMTVDNGQHSMNEFYETIKAIDDDIASIRAACKELDKLASAALFAPLEQDGASAKEAMSALLTKTNRITSHSKTLLNAIRAETTELKRDRKGITDANLRVRVNLERSTLTKFVDAAKEYENKQSRYRLQVKRKAERVIRAVKPLVTEEEMTAVFNHEDGVARVLQAAVLQSRTGIDDVLTEVQDTYKDVRRLEASIMELHRMFMDLALLVEQQGETLDNIELQVIEAGEYIRHGDKNLAVAVDTAKTVRGRQCRIWLAIAAILAAITLIIVIYIEAKPSK
ncbi:soluble NSF attachment protein receptor [Tribonema minus]|uniref:Soluble NSF attachment protein receptor n=1 Tax=Tribonema minus TaxID=303371 RepID=A0A836CCH9_9STRA|nr:soluble NSF attachment protein receptor [Tribonema minus]